jgi:hypothetical protein
MTSFSSFEVTMIILYIYIALRLGLKQIFWHMFSDI